MATAPAPAVPARPYPGIEAFSYVDHDVFFAREEDADKLLRYVTVYRGVLVYGPSGAGKSSLINAGFIPRAVADGYTPDRIRFQPRAGQEIIVERIALQSEGKPPFLNSAFASERDTASRLVFSIADFRAKLAAVSQTAGVYPILIFDQLEEFISLFEEAPAGEGLKAARRVQADLLDLLVYLYRDASLRVKLLYVFREDYLARLGALFVHCPDLRDTFLHLTPPRADALEEIILGPFRRFPGRFGREFAEPLARRLQFAFEERSDSSELNLSEVQIACQRLWLSVDPAREFAQKGLQGLLEDYLAESLARLPAEQRDPAVALLSRMVTAGGLRNVISEDDLIGRVVSEDGLRRARLEAALASLVSSTRLVRRERREDVVFFEIVSEFLVPWIRRQRAARQVRTQRRRFAALAAMLLFIAVASIGAATWILRQRTEAVIAREWVRKAREAEKTAHAEAEVEQQARELTERRLAAAIIERNAALAERDSSRKAEPPLQPAARSRLDQLMLEKQQLYAENAKLAQDLSAAEAAIGKLRQEMEVARERTVIASRTVGDPGRQRIDRPAPKPVAEPPQPGILSGTLRAGQLTPFTGPKPFDSGIACFKMETAPSDPLLTRLTVLAVAEEPNMWQGNHLGKASDLLRGLAERLFEKMREKDQGRRQAAANDIQKRVGDELRRTLHGNFRVYSSVESQHSTVQKRSEVQRLSFKLDESRYELHLQSLSAQDFRMVVAAAP